MYYQRFNIKDLLIEYDNLLSEGVDRYVIQNKVKRNQVSLSLDFKHVPGYNKGIIDLELLSALIGVLWTPFFLARKKRYIKKEELILSIQLVVELEDKTALTNESLVWKKKFKTKKLEGIPYTLILDFALIIFDQDCVLARKEIFQTLKLEVRINSK